MRTVYLVIGLLLSQVSLCQAVKEKLTNAINVFEKDAQFKHAVISMYVVDSKRGVVIYEKNQELGLAPASTQKIITSVSAFELLGKDYRYKTEIFYSGKINGTVKFIHIKAYGDPTLGSWRYAGTKEEIFFSSLKKALDEAAIKKINFAPVVIISNNFSSQLIPDGWILQDIGNYYGAGAGGLNWRENQYDIILSSGNDKGDPAHIKELIPSYTNLKFINEVKAGSKGSGDNAYIYPGINNDTSYIRGTIPADEKKFSISGSIPDPRNYFLTAMNNFLSKNNFLTKESWVEKQGLSQPTLLYSYLSPQLDSINFWFLKKSVNLYGEAFVKTIAVEKGKEGSTSRGIEIIRDFWNKKGIEKSALNIIDGSGLSPANRITTKALVQVLEYAKDKKWFISFYNALPEMNGIKMKDGYIGGVRSYTGYVKSRSGQEYTFAFIVNNFDGSAGAVREKMYKVLDLLK